MFELEMKVEYTQKEEGLDGGQPVRKVREEAMPYEESTLIAQVRNLVDAYDADTIELYNGTYYKGYTDLTVQVYRGTPKFGHVGYIHTRRFCPLNESEEAKQAFYEEGYNFQEAYEEVF